LLGQLYGDGEEGDLSDSAPDVARWLGDIRHYFPDSVVQMMQHDALDKYKLRKLLDHPDLIEKIESVIPPTPHKPENKKILVLTKLVDHAKLLNKLIPNSVVITGSTAKKIRKEMYKEFKEKIVNFTEDTAKSEKVIIKDGLG